MKSVFLYFFLFCPLLCFISPSFSTENYADKNIHNDLNMAKNMKSLLQLNLTYNESKEANELLMNLQISYQNYSNEITNLYFIFFQKNQNLFFSKK
jgi:predicted HTH transcriptional regulator